MTNETLLAISIAVASFVFTLYQWLVTMNSRRPKLKFLRFQLDEVFVNEDYKDFVIYPKMNFIVVNLSDLPNAIISMKVRCRIQQKWHEGQLKYGSKSAEELFPILVQPHASTASAKQSVGYAFPVFPTEQDLKELKIIVDLGDQYDKVYRLRFQRKNFPELFIRHVPRFEPNEKLLGEVCHVDPSDNDPVIIRVLYIEDKKDPAKNQIAVRQYGRSSGWGGTYIDKSHLESRIQESQEDRFLYHDLGSSDDHSKKVYVQKQGNLPDVIEVELVYGGRTEAKQFKLPAAFVDQFRS